MQTKTREEVATMYGISRRTLHEWFKKAGIEVPERALLTPKNLERIYEIFGNPENPTLVSQDFPKPPKISHFGKI